MDLKQVDNVMKESEGGLAEKRGSIIISGTEEDGNHHEIDSTTALQLFLDHISISSIPGISNSPVLELNLNDCLQDAIPLLYERNVSGAPITDVSDSGDQKFLERNIGFIDFYSMVLWSIEMGELAKSFMWNPFFPVHSDDTLFHVLLLFVKHPLKVISVMDQKASLVTGFLTMLVENRIVVPVVDMKTKTLIGNVRNYDIHFLLDDDDLFINRKSLMVEEFINLDARRNNQSSDPTTEGDLGALLSAGILCLKSKFLQRMDPVTNRMTDTLRKAMENLMATKSSCSFIVDESKHVTGVVTLRDIIMQVSPLWMDSRINGGGFFESALEQAGCHTQIRSMTGYC